MIEKTYIVTDRYDIDHDGFVTDDRQAARDYFETQSPRLQWRCEYETSGRVHKSAVEWYFLEYDEVNGERVLDYKSYGYGDYLRERDGAIADSRGVSNG